ncbi:MAG: hypothetical protein HYV42_02995 [Candidatus Magasanikbacteria bacterium]|nr:hypothetical protein [Candidatus Magasanikbacteria bacterium]
MANFKHYLLSPRIIHIPHLNAGKILIGLVSCKIGVDYGESGGQVIGGGEAGI